MKQIEYLVHEADSTKHALVLFESCLDRQKTHFVFSRGTQEVLALTESATATRSTSHKGK
eukprot:scaffold16330_cov88-Skeletonema_dohrnii-CCMP3373.AAC.4